MAITFIGSATGTTSATIPAHVAGDLIIAFAFRDGSTTQATQPAGWTIIGSAGAGVSASAGRLSYKIAASSSETTGTWTNATDFIVHVYRGDDPLVIGGTAAGQSAGTAFDFPAISTVIGNGRSWIAGFAGHVSTNTGLETPPTGMTNRSTRIGSGEVAGHDTNGTVTSWAAAAATVGGTSGGFYVRTVEIREVPATVASGDPPFIVSVGAAVSGLGDISVALPSLWAEDDHFVLVVESGSATSAPAGWSLVVTPPSGDGVTYSSVFWRKATASESAVTVTGPGDHTLGFMFAVRGARGDASPINVTASDGIAASTTVTCPGLTTTVDNCLVVAVASRDNDSAATTAFSAWTNASLVTCYELGEGGTTSGNGGGIAVAVGVKATAGAVSATTATVTSAAQSRVTFALEPAALDPDGDATGATVPTTASVIAGYASGGGVGLQAPVQRFVSTADAASPVDSGPLIVPPGHLVIALAAHERSSASPTQAVLTDTAGWTWTERYDLIYNTAADPRLRATVWSAVSPSATPNTITLTQGTTTALGLAVVSFENADAVPTNFINSRLADGTATLAFGTVPPAHASAAFVFAAENNAITNNAGGMSELFDADNAGAQRIAFYYDLTSPDPAPTWTSSNTFTFGVGFRVVEVGAAAADGAVTVTTASAVAGTASGEAGAVDGNATGVTASLVASAVAGTASGGAAATGVTSSTAASAVAGTASGERTGAATGATASTVGSVVAGTASGVRQGDATGATSSLIASAVVGTASGVRTGTATGATSSAVMSAVAGTAAGERTGAATGATSSLVASIVAGTASATRTGAATGATATLVASVVAGTGSGGTASTGAGTTATAQMSAVAGTASGERTGTATGTTVSSVASAVPGSAVGAGDGTATGATASAQASVVGGTATGGASATGATATLTASSIPGTATAAGSGTGAGATLAVVASAVPSSATGQRHAEAAGATLSLVANVVAGTPGGAAVIAGATIDTDAILLPGSASGAIGASASGALLSISTSTVPGTASGVRQGEASGAIGSSTAILVPGAGYGGFMVGAPGKVLVAGNLITSQSVSGTLPQEASPSGNLVTSKTLRGNLP